jgi:hypothetical protein
MMGSVLDRLIVERAARWQRGREHTLDFAPIIEKKTATETTMGVWGSISSAGGTMTEGRALATGTLSRCPGLDEASRHERGSRMNPEEVRNVLRQQPFEPFRLVMTDGTGYEIRHPDLLWVGRSTAMVGLTGEPGQTF